MQWVDSAPVSEVVADGFAEVMGRLQSLGATVEEIDDPEFAPPGMIQELSAAEAASVHRGWWQEGCEYGPEVHERLALAMEVTLDQYVEAQVWRSRLRQRAAAAFAQHDLIATPTAGVTRKEIGVDTVSTLRGEVPHRSSMAVFTALVNHVGAPAVAVPLAGTGTPPVSLQLIAPWWHEHRLLEVAMTLERQGVVALPG